MSEPVRLYSPNPNAPGMYGAAEPQMRNLASMIPSLGGPFDAAWGALPPEARQRYMGLAKLVGELSPGAAVRDTLDASGEVGNAALQGSPAGVGMGAAKMGLAALGLMPAMRVAKPIGGYHGSPYKFDRFDSSKIGTGEGNAAYGIGTYIAEREGVASTYKNSNRQLSFTDPRDNLNDWISRTRGWITPEHRKNLARYVQEELPYVADPRLAALKDNPEAIRHITTILGDDSSVGKSVQDVTLKAYQALDRILPKPSPGYMYKVDIHADPKRFLDWDKAVPKTSDLRGLLTDSASNLKQRALTDADLREAFNATYVASLPDLTGRLLYGSLSKAQRNPGSFPVVDKNPVAASAALRDHGLTGIRYLDGFSRRAGDGTSNYVIFPGNEHLIEILRRYGIAPVGAGAAIGGAVAAQPEGGLF
jgi:hypothetical protein